jgi:hypothetical protein
MALATAQIALNSSTATKINTVGGTPSSHYKIYVKNLDASINVFVGVTGVTSSTGLRLNSGETTIIDPVVAGTDLYAISASGTPSVAVMAITF